MRIRNKAFTLIEMIIVIVIIGILAAIVVPQFMSIRDTAVNAALESSVNNIYSYLAALQG
jgi:prepilin-type N-terminal cleavage/methylation domain-containing protein